MVSITYRCRRIIIKERGIRSLMKKLRTRILTLILLPTLMIFIGLILYVSINVQKEVEQTAEEMLYSHGERLSGDRKSTRLNSSHVAISYAVFCLKKKT